jgi:glucose/arabinose dehydrogenase
VTTSWLSVAIALLMLAGCSDVATLSVADGTGPRPVLPAPDESLIPTVNIAPARGWPHATTPNAAPGLTVQAYAALLDHPRWLMVLPNGDVLVAETGAPPRPDDAKGVRGWFMNLMMLRAGAASPSANRITLLRDTDGDGVADLRSVLLDSLNSPFGMALVGDRLYVADTDAVLSFPYTSGDTRITTPGVKLVDLPAGPINHHWTKNLIASADGTRLYVTVGSNSNVGERGMGVETGRASIWVVDIATGAHRVYASGLRNPNGLSWEPATGALWTVVNERDELGSDLVPDYLTSVRDGGFYGWPYSYYGQHVDPRVEAPAPDLVAAALVPDYALGPHTASLGLAAAIPGPGPAQATAPGAPSASIASGASSASGLPAAPIAPIAPVQRAAGLPAPYTNGMFIGQHGSWNRKPHSGYRVIFVPFVDGRPAGGAPLDVLTGFLSAEGTAYGRPVGVALDGRGALLVADDVGDVVWRVSARR